MFEQFETRQHQILALLQQSQSGLTIDALVTNLEISRTAVNQHMVGLERDGLIKKFAKQKSTGGRPGWCYQITDEGMNRLPKHYSWFSELLLNTLKEELGAVEKSRQRRSHQFSVLTYWKYAPRAKLAAALLDELF